MTDVLILDDDALMRRLLASQLRALDLESAGYDQIVECALGHDALRVIERSAGRVGLVFCDLQMPEMDGIEFVRHLGAAGFDGAIAFVSGEDPRILEAAAQVAVAHGLCVLPPVAKPVAIDGLRQILADAGPGRRPAACSKPREYTAEELREAIRAGHLVNHYQPKVNIQTGALVGVEALVRWQHPTDGLLGPDKFIELAESAGLICQLGETVLAAAFRDVAAWDRAGLAIDVAVNMSMSNLSELDFPDRLAEQALEAQVALQRVIIEITEGRVMEDPRAQLDILTRLRLKQVRLSIDDFGTGYSGLAQLKNLPFAEIKIDRGFVHRAAQDPALRAIVDASLHLARELQMSTVAEGVEDEEDWDFLRATDCLLAQGYFIGRPMPATHVVIWADEWNGRRVRALA